MILRHHRVVGADTFNVTAVTRGRSLGDDDPVERAFLRATTGESDLESHEYSSFRRELWLN